MIKSHSIELVSDDKVREIIISNTPDKDDITLTVLDEGGSVLVELTLCSDSAVDICKALSCCFDWGATA